MSTRVDILGPIYGLWCGVIIQAVVDIGSEKKINKIKRKPKQNQRDRDVLQQLEEARLQAIHWFCGDEVIPGSFTWICDQCDLDERKIRELALSREGRRQLLNRKFSVLQEGEDGGGT